MKKYAIAAIFILIGVSTARAEIFDAVNIPDEEKIAIRFLYKGIELAKPPEKPFVLRFTAAESSVEALYITRMVGEGAARHVEVEIRGKSFNGYTNNHLFKFRPGKKLDMASLEHTVFNQSGKKIRSEYFDLSESTPPFPERMTHPYTFPLVVRGLDFNDRKEHKFYIWFNPTMLFAMKVSVKGEEEITVPAGKFNCYRLEMGPDLVDFAGPLVARVIKPLIAPYVAWLDTKPPHKIVKYQGPFGMVNIAGPSEIYEAVKYGD